ncbi:MAG: hypothetical protein KF690_01330 [Bacteroidetes bacterium]|nr:hypothetical protein [Bacteroidota bacterium]
MSTQYIAHRINTLTQLAELPHTQMGIELDLRDRGDRLILQHDPFGDGEDFAPLLAEYVKRGFAGPLILNVKSERIEHRVRDLVQQYGLRNYFFLDSSFPMLHLLSQQGETRLAIRFSEWESLDSVLLMKDRVQWVWVDCFTYLPLTAGIFRQLTAAGLQVCIVSPELQGRPDDIERYRDQLAAAEIVPHAICTKHYNFERWQTVFA